MKDGDLHAELLRRCLGDAYKMNPKFIELINKQGYLDGIFLQPRG
jgi:hypothetical protein